MTTCGEDSTYERWQLSTGCMGGGLNIRTMGGVPLARVLKPHNSVSCVCFWCLPSCPPLAGALGECLGVEESVHGPLKRMRGFPSVFHLTRMDRIPSFFHSQMLRGLLFPVPVLQAGEPGMELKLLTPPVRPLWPRQPSRFLTVTCGGGKS